MQIEPPSPPPYDLNFEGKSHSNGVLTVILDYITETDPSLVQAIVLRLLVKEHEEYIVQLYMDTVHLENTNVKPSSQSGIKYHGDIKKIIQEESLCPICHLELHTMVNKMLSM